MAYFKVNGTEILPFIADGGFKWSDTDFDSENAGRTLDGKMWRGRVCSKIKYELTARSLTVEECNILIKALDHEFVTVETDLDPKHGECKLTMYNSSRNASIRAIYNATESLWDGITFNLIQR